MYEISFVKRYILGVGRSFPLISVTSILSLSSVVVMILLSVTSLHSIKKNWLKRILSIDAPIRATYLEDIDDSVEEFLEEMASIYNLTFRSSESFGIIFSYDSLESNIVETFHITNFSGEQEIGSLIIEPNIDEINHYVKSCKDPLKLQSMINAMDIEMINGKSCRGSTILVDERDYKDFRLLIFKDENLDILPVNSVRIEKCEIIRSFDKSPILEPPWPYEVNGLWKIPDGTILFPKRVQGNPPFGETCFIHKIEEDLTCRVSISGFYNPDLSAKTIFTSDEYLPRKYGSRSNDRMEIWIDDITNVRNITEKLNKEILIKGLHVNFSAFLDHPQTKEFLKNLKYEENLLLLIGFIMLLVTSTNILSISTTMTNKMRREISLLMILGAKRWSIFLIFGFTGLVIGLLASSIGVLLGKSILYGIPHIMESNRVFGEALPSDMTPLSILAMTIIISLLSSITFMIPLLQYTRISPMENIKKFYE